MSSSRQLLDAVYDRLGYESGALRNASAEPSRETRAEWVEKGDWLALAKHVGAEKVFFVNEYPVIIFAEQTTADDEGWLEMFNSAWCMARPQLLFLARQGELAVLDLTKRPGRVGELRAEGGRLLETVELVSQVEARLSKYRREQVESGRLFEESHFGQDDRADRALIRDLGAVRTALVADGLSPGHAHALIGRSIFVRYLEDRGVLTEQYFRKVIRRARAERRKQWGELLDDDNAATQATGRGGDIFYPRVLRDKRFAYALFRSLSEDFNGDMFPINEEEELAVTDKQLALLRRFLLGDIEGGLFFFAYRFDIIPIELISSIYEKFYSLLPDKQRDDGSFYTPASLVDFVLSQTLTEDKLDAQPRITDPACGSGIFLVESFRRIVRHRCRTRREKLRFEDLRDILSSQIRGIDINREAIRVAAFSLYLAMLHYLEPPDILQHKLPCLTYKPRARRDPSKHLDILLVSDAFHVESNVESVDGRRRFGSKSADIVVGNPPWGTPKANEELASDGGVFWCAHRNLSVGDKERSQSFVHRTMDLLSDGGRAGLLLSTGIFFKRHDNSKKFRRQWLESAALKSVVNFAAVREAFFRTTSTNEGEGKGAIAPFASVVFDKLEPSDDSMFTYWSAKETGFVSQVQAVVLNKADSALVNQRDFSDHEELWKVYWWGGHHDDAIVRRLRLEKTLGDEFDAVAKNFRTGFVEGRKGTKPVAWLKKFREFPSDDFERYGPIPISKLRPTPGKVRRCPKRDLFEGPRLLLKRGIGNDGVVARFENEDFAFRHSIYGINIPKARERDAKVAVGVLWSSLTKYYLFMTSGSWGTWHDEVLKETYTTIPLRLRGDEAIRQKIVATVDALRSLHQGEPTLFERTASPNDVAQLERTLNDAVFSLFDLSDFERARVTEFCEYGFDLLANGLASDAVKPVQWSSSFLRFGRSSDLGGDGGGRFTDYVKTFLQLWEPRLKPQSGQFRWRVIDAGPLLVAIFQTETAKERLPDPTDSDDSAWRAVLAGVGATIRKSFRERVYIEGFSRIVTDSDIIVLKRNERRLWTSSAAREDAEATMLMAMSAQGGPRSARSRRP